MVISNLFFYVFSIITVASACMVIAGKNPVHSVLFLILCFFNSAGLFLILGAEFLALILVIVYVGAVAVLFLFVVMMLDVDFTRLRAGFLTYLPIGGLIGFIMFVELVMVLGTWNLDLNLPVNNDLISDLSNTRALGNIIYTEYIYFFQLSGLILLVAMIGAIVLTINHKQKAKRQNIFEQVTRDPKESIKNVNVKPGQGI